MRTLIVYYQNEKDGSVNTLSISYRNYIEVMTIENLLQKLIPNAHRAWF